MSELPPGWNWIQMSEISDIQMGQSPDSRSYNDSGDGLPFFQGKAEFGSLYPSVRKWCTEPKKVAEAGDILLSIRAPVGPTNLAGEKCCIGRGLASIRGSSAVSQKYLLYYLRNIEPWLSSQGTGSTFSAVSGDFVRSIRVPLPPLAEQQRIADKLDALLARMDACRARLGRASAVIKRFRQAVLAAAVSGRLTEDWRGENGRGKSDWGTTTIGNLIDRIEAGINFKCEERPPEAGERGLVKISAVTWGTFNDEESKTLPKGKGVPEATRIKVGDFLISRANTIELVGACVIVEQVERQVYLSDKVLRLVVSEDDKKWLLYWLRSSEGRRQIESRASGNQLSMRNISQTNLKSVEVLLPHPDERDEIVRRVETLFNYADRLEARLAATQARVAQLTPSLLAKAFRGEM